VTVTLGSEFERDLATAALDATESRLVGERDNIVAGFVRDVHRNLRAYADRHGYDVDSTIESVRAPEVTRSDGELTIEVGWASEQMARWEFGTSTHTIEGDPVLAFVWAAAEKRGADPPAWIREEFDQARDEAGRFRSGWQVFLPEVTVRGLPESRAIRDSLNDLRRLLETTT